MKNVTRILQMLFVVILTTFVFATQSMAQTTLFTESFENGGAVPAGWNSSVVSGGNTITFVTSTAWPSGYTAYNGTYLVMFNSFSASGGVNLLKRTTPVSTVGYANVTVDFAWLESSGYAGVLDKVDVMWSTNGTTWTTAGTFNRYNAVQGWKIKSQVLPAGANNQATLYIAYQFTSAYGNDCYLDLTHITASPSATGTLAGTVTNSVGGAAISGASVVVNALAPVLTSGTGTYSVPALTAGTVNVSITKTGFVPYSGTAVIVGGSTTTLNVALAPNPNVNGTVTDASTGLPVVGATVTIDLPSPTNLPITMTIAGGIIPTTQVSLVGVHNVYINKTGYDQWVGSVTLTAGGTVAVTAALLPTAVQPGPFTAALNNPTTPTAVNLNWGVPQGMYQIIYDDGGEENFAIWATAGNYNALKFTPLSWPVKLIGGKVDLGLATDYPANALPFTTFTMIAFKADGPGGTPGTKIDSVNVTATAFGWADFSFATPLTIASGDFFLVMKQGGIPPHAAGVAVDLTNTQLRSYSKFVTGGGPWVPAAGNFMMRAIVQGLGGPMMDNPTANKNLITASAVEGLIYQKPVATVTGYEGTADYPAITPTYQVWRLQQGQEGTQASWTSIWTGATNTTVDNGWPSLACGPYRWAVEAIYSPPGQRFSAPTFSNVIGKCWTANVNVCVSLTCAANPKAGTVVKLVNTAYVDTNYTKTTDTSGCVHFTNVWKGSYTLTVTRFTYPVYTQTVSVLGDVNLNVTLLQNTDAPTNLVVNDVTLHASWSPPRTRLYHVNEDWASGSFATNNWTTSGGTNWGVAAGTGNPAPSAMFNWTPQVTNYNQFLTSKTFVGAHAPQVKLKYDYFLSNFGTTNVNTMAVELWNGATWTPIKSYTNQNGNIPWTTEVLDITSVTNLPAFQIRFHAAGADSYDINNWNIDNIQVYSTDGTTGPNPCVLGYNFYLNNILSAFTPDTTYNIPPNQVVYNTQYTACVKAVYGSGYSNPICVTFTSHYLYPARNLVATGIECSVYLTWMKPVTAGDAPGDQSYAPITSVQPVAEVTNLASKPTTAGVATSLTAGMDNATAILYNNGPLVNSAGTGAGGADESVLYTPLTTYGFGAQQTAGNSMADDFIVPPGAGWDPTKFTFYTYQTGGGSGASTITGLFFRVWNGDPTAGGTVIWGDLTTNRMTATSWSNIYRTLAVGGATDRAIMKVEATVTGLHLPAGTYWVEWQYTGSLASGPWAPPISITGTNVTGNGKQNVAGTWSNAMDGTYQQGLPFIIEGPGGTGGGGTPVGLKGYRVYRDNAMVHQVLSPDTLSWYDYNLNPGTYKYDVKALYDLTSYGIATPPAPWGESLMNTAGLQTVTLNCGAPLPFYEPWDAGTFAFHSWTVPAGATNHWSVNTGIGNPAPCADFTWSTAIANYSQAMTSEVIDASAWTCAGIWLDFDVKLLDRNATGKEKLTIDIFYNNAWHQKGELTNNGSTNWVAKHIDISTVRGKSFRVRFVANGVNSADLLHWYVDNIHAYGICIPPNTLAGKQAQFTTTLTWKAPVCPVSSNGVITIFTFDDGTWENGWTMNANNLGWFGNDFPIAAATTGLIQKVSVYFVDNGTGSVQPLTIDIYSAAHVLLGSSATFSAGPVNTWIDVPINDVPFTGEFFAMVKFNMLPAQSYYLASDENGPYAAQDLAWNQSATGVWAKASTLGANPAVFLERVTALVTSEMKSVTLIPGAPMPAGVKSDAKANQAHVSGDSHNYMTMGALKVANSDSSALQGYNVYRTDNSGAGAFTKINANVVTALTYADVHPSTTPLASKWKYFVTDVFFNSVDQSFLCEASSDTILVNFPATGINELGNGQIMIYPNPATELVNVKSDYTINRIDVINFVGQPVYSNTAVDSKTTKIDVSTFSVGVYFVKVSTSEGLKTVKITVTH